MKISVESSFFSKLLNEVYQVHLKDYSLYNSFKSFDRFEINLIWLIWKMKRLEKMNLQNKFKFQMDRFYESIGHTKRNVPSG